MFDFGFDKLALIGGVALIVIGPERLPRVARTMGVLLGKAQRYMSQVQAEVKRSMDVEELNKMRTDIQDAAHGFQQQVQGSLDDVRSELNHTPADAWQNAPAESSYISYQDPVRKNWRIKRGAVPLWYKQKVGVKRHAQSGAARVARFRPPSHPR
jgi:sec-independent protein translocase protein TatB